MSVLKHFKVTRTVKMDHIQVLDVLAADIADVPAATEEFLETDWSPAEQARLGVVVINETSSHAEDVPVQLVVEPISEALEPDLATASRLASDTLMQHLDSVKH